MIVLDKFQWVDPKSILAINIESVDGYPQIVLHLSGGQTIRSQSHSFDEAHRKADSLANSINQMGSGHPNND